jgi:hypothetical protein
MTLEIQGVMVFNATFNNISVILCKKSGGQIINKLSMKINMRNCEIICDGCDSINKFRTQDSIL